MKFNPSVNLTTSVHFGVVENRDSDPLKLGRCRVRVVGIHSEDKTVLPTADLPWAYPMQPPHSAAMNGIGYSPTGPVEGTWCMVVFRDEFKQHPIIIGTVGGIPEEFENLKVENIASTASTAGGLVSSDGSPVVDSQGNPVETAKPTEQQAAAEADIKKPSQMSLSDEGRAKIKGYKPVATDAAISAAESATKSAIKVPITQGMFDATVSLMADSGVDQVTKTKYMSALNSGKYEEAAALIPSTNVAVVSGTAASNPNQALKDALGKRESSNNYQAQNSGGYIGKYQMGAAMLTDLGYVKRGTTNAMLNDPSVFTGKDGITSKQDFLNNSQVQESAMDAELTMNERRLIKQGVITAGSDQREKSGYLATSHLLGTGGAQKLKNGVVGVDGNGTSGSSYYTLGANSAGSASTDPLSRQRREEEKKLFLKNGIPKKDASGVENVPDKTESTSAENRSTDNPVVLPEDKENTTTATSGSQGSETHTFVTADGFRDPNGVYPKKDWLNEPDTHRLARHQKIAQTIVSVKEAARVTGVVTAFGVTWDQPTIPYNAKYPFNQTRITESGHVEEWDDTKNNERIQTYHTVGTYEEVDCNGTRVTRIVGDDYEILERNGHVLIKGQCFVTIKGDSRVRIENNSYIEVLGNLTTDVTGNMEFGVGGHVKFHSGGDFSVDAPNIWLNSGVASDVQIPSERGQPVQFGTLVTPTRFSEEDANYETPEEGDPTEFNNAMLASGKKTEEDLTPTDPEAKKEEAAAETKPPDNKPPTGCAGLKDDDIKPTLIMSKRYRLGDLTSVGSSGAPAPGSVHYGVPALQIVCNMQKLSTNVLDVIASKYPNMKMTSVWRSQAVNTSVGGSKKSDHLTGCAADIQLSGFSRKQHYEAIIEIQKLLPAYKQLILEYKGSSTWIHVAFKEGENSNQSLTIDAARNVVIKNGAFVLI